LFKYAAQITSTFSKKHLLSETSTIINHSQIKPPPDQTTLHVMISSSNFSPALMNKITLWFDLQDPITGKKRKQYFIPQTEATDLLASIPKSKVN